MKIYQSFIGEHQRTFVSPGAIALDAVSNGGDSAREYELFKGIHATDPDCQSTPWGLVSWKFRHKCLVSVEEFAVFAKARLDDGYDCAFINPMISAEALYFNVWEQGAHSGHKGMDRIAGFLSARIGANVMHPMGRNSFAFCNYFVATPTFWRSYFEFVDSAIQLLETERVAGTEVGIIYGGSAHYARDRNATMRPFVIERLFSSFVAGSPLRIAAYEFNQAHYIAKFGVQLGEFLHKLSGLKNRGLATRDAQALQRFASIRRTILERPYKAIPANLDDPMSYFVSPEYLNERF